MTDLIALAGQVMDKYGMQGCCGASPGLDGVLLYRQEIPQPRSPMVYSSGIFVLIMGRKLVHFGQQTFSYDGDNYFAVGLPLAMECEVIASPEEPVFALHIPVDPSVLRSIAGTIGLNATGTGPEGTPLGVAPLVDEMRDAVTRLLRVLASKEDTAVLGEAAVHEVIYRTLRGPAGFALHGLLGVDDRTARVASVMDMLNARPAERFTIADMADSAGMSPSAFHRAFQQIAQDSPLQYLKKVRLSRASDLMTRDNYRVGMAAAAVGYESAAHFSRDFKSHFGIPPADARRRGYAFAPAD